MGFSLWYGIKDKTRTHLNAVRVNAARDGLTERNLDYVESYIVHQKRNHTERCGFLLDGQ